MKIAIPTLLIFVVFMNSMELSFQSNNDVPEVFPFSSSSSSSQRHTPNYSIRRGNNHDTIIMPNGSSMRYHHNRDGTSSDFPPPLRTQSIQHPFDESNFVPPEEDVIIKLPNGVRYKSITGETNLRIIHNRNTGVVTVIYRNGFSQRVNPLGRIVQ